MIRSASVLVLLALCFVAQARSFDSVQQSDDGNMVVKVHFESNDDQPDTTVHTISSSSSSSFTSPFSLFPNFRLFSSSPAPQEQPRLFSTSSSLFSNDDFGDANRRSSPFSRMFDNFFRFAGFRPHTEDKDEIVSFEMTPTITFAEDKTDAPTVFSFDDDESDSDDEVDVNAPLSRLFSRMTALINPLFNHGNDMQFRSQDEVASKPSRRGGCTLMQRCAEDINRLCSSAKRIQIAQAIPRCLARHRSELSEQCGEYIDRRAAGLEPADDEQPQEDTEEASEEVVPMESVEPTVESVAEEAAPATPPVPETPETACHSAAASLCPTVDQTNMVELMACLHANQAQVPPLCLDHVKSTAAFNCAEDAKRLCSEFSDRLAIGRCLKQHVTELSAACVSAVRPKSVEKVQTVAPVLSTAVFDRAPTPSAALAGNNKQTYLIAAGFIGLVALVAVGGAVIIRRRRARRSPGVQVNTVQLVNPNQDYSAVGAAEPSADGSYSAAFGRELRAQEQL